MQLTAKGQALNAKIQAGTGTIPLEITRVVSASSFSDDPLNLETLADLDIRQTARIVRQETVGTRAIVEVQLSNQGNPTTGEPAITTGYELFQFGMGAIDPDEGEILYRISQFDTSTWVPPATEMGWTINPSWNFVVGNASEVIVQIDPAGMVTVQMMNAAIADALAAHNIDPEAHENRFAAMQAQIDFLMELLSPNRRGMILDNGVMVEGALRDVASGIISPLVLRERNR